MTAYRAHREIPGPAGIPFAGNLLQIAGDRLAFLTGLRRRYGRTAGFRVCGERFVLLSDPRDVAHVLVENSANYRKGVGLQEARLVLGDGLLTSEGEIWRERHARLVPVLRRVTSASITERCESIVAGAMEEWLGRRRVDLVHELAVIALRIVAAALIGADLRAHSRPLASHFAAFERRVFKAMIAGLIAPRPIARRFSELLLTPYRRKLAALCPDLDLADHGLVDHDDALTLLYTGYDTTSATMASALAEITARPELERAIVHELAVESSSPLLTKTIQETLRLHPPVWLIPRMAVEEDSLPTCSVPPQTHVVICTYVLHRDPETWPEAEAFDPARFEHNQPPPGAFLPFGAGPRHCIGSAFAQTETSAVLGMLLRNLRLVRRATVRFQARLTLRPQRLDVDVERRSRTTYSFL